MSGKRSPLLIVLGTLDDPHVEAVSRRTSALGLETVVVDHNERTDLTIEQRSSGELIIAIDESRIDPSQNAVLVWNRLKLRPGVPFFFPDRFYDSEGLRSNNEERAVAVRLTDRALEFLSEQWRATFQIFLRLFENFTVNNVVAAARIENKLIQQLYAAKAGFMIPDSLLTNQISLARSFVDNGNTIMKSLGKPTIRPDQESKEGAAYQAFMTTPLSADHLQTTSNTSFRLVPSLLQRHIRKAFELRVVYVNKKMFAFRIPSQDFEVTSVDWRYGNYFLEFKSTDLPREIELRLSTFMDSCGLATGSADLIVDEDGQHWFLEVNPQGAWMWLDRLVDGAIGESFAQFFVAQSNSELA